MIATIAAATLAAACLAEVEPGLGVDALDDRRTDGAAVALVVPDAGPTTSELRAREALVRGAVVNSLRDELPADPPRGRICARAPVLVGIPAGSPQPNDRRYLIVLRGGTGLLTSESTRISGLVSIADVATDRLRVEPHVDPRRHLRDLDARIRNNNSWRQPASLLAAAAVAGASLFLPLAPLAVALLLLANLVFGVVGIAGAAALLLVAAVAAAALRLRPATVAAVSVATLTVYLLALGFEAEWVALSPLGPTQNARFYGLSNLLETILLVPALLAGAVLGRRHGPAGLAAVALLAVVAVAGSRFGADGGGAIVLAVGFGVLATLLLRRRWAAAVIGVIAIGAVLALVVGPATHVTDADLPGALLERIELSWARVTDSLPVGLAVLAAVAALTVLVVRGPRTPLALAFAVAIATSLVVNDSPLDVAVWGLAGYLAVSRWDEAARVESSSR